MSDFYEMAQSAIDIVPDRDTNKFTPSLLTEVMDLNPRVKEYTAAKTDADVLVEWSNMAKGHNKLSRQREVRRFAKWLIEKNLFLSEIRARDVEEYFRVLKDPPSHWVGKGGKFIINGKQNPKWRPLRSAGLNPGSLSQSRTLLSGLFQHLSHIGWVSTNFVRIASRQTGQEEPETPSKTISKECIDYLHERFFEEWLPLSNAEMERKQRARMILASLYLIGVRREELCNLRMCDVQPFNGGWAIKVRRQRCERNLIPASKEFISHLVEYRRFFGLSPDYPVKESLEPLIFRLVGSFGPLTPHGLYKEIKFITRKAADSCYDPVIASEIRQITTHWYRQTHVVDLIRKAQSPY